MSTTFACVCLRCEAKRENATWSPTAESSISILKFLTHTLNYWVKTGVLTDEWLFANSNRYSASFRYVWEPYRIRIWAENQLLTAEKYFMDEYLAVSTHPNKAISFWYEKHVISSQWDVAVHEEPPHKLGASKTSRTYEIKPTNDLAKEIFARFEERLMTEELSEGY